MTDLRSKRARDRRLYRGNRQRSCTGTGTATPAVSLALPWFNTSVGSGAFDPDSCPAQTTDHRTSARPICEWTVWKREAHDPGLDPHSGPFPRIWSSLKTLKFISLSESYRAYHQNICLKHAPDEAEISQLAIGVSILRLYRFYKTNSTVKTGPVL